MSEYYTFAGASFLALLSDSGTTPAWQPKLDATDRPLIGTDRFERSIRSRTWSLDLTIWIEPSTTALTAFLSLRTAYALATVGSLTIPCDPEPDPPPDSVTVILTTFDVTPMRGGIDGYRGKAIFSLPGGI